MKRKLYDIKNRGSWIEFHNQTVDNYEFVEHMLKNSLLYTINSLWPNVRSHGVIDLGKNC